MARGDRPFGLDGQRHRAGRPLPAAAAAHPVLPRAVRPGDQPPDGPDPGEAGDVASHPSRKAGAAARGDPPAGPSHRAGVARFSPTPSWRRSSARAIRRFFSHWIATTWAVSAGPEGLRARLDEICEEAAQAVRLGATHPGSLRPRGRRPAMPRSRCCLAVGAVHHRLDRRAGCEGRLRSWWCPASPAIAHDLACLVGFGASAVNPYLAIEQRPRPGCGGEPSMSTRRGSGELPGRAGGRSAQDHVEDGHLHHLRIPGSGAVRGHRARRRGVPSWPSAIAPRRLRGIGIDELARQALDRHQAYCRRDERSRRLLQASPAAAPSMSRPDGRCWRCRRRCAPATRRTGRPTSR